MAKSKDKTKVRFQCPDCGEKTTTTSGATKVRCRCGALMKKQRAT